MFKHFPAGGHAAALILKGILAGAVLLTALGVSWACGRSRAHLSRDPSPDNNAGTASRPSLLLVTIDTWRWDYIGASGSGWVETPHLDQLVAEGVYERKAVTPCPLTTPAHASILTGLDPARHRVWDCAHYSLAETIPTLAEDFHAAGFTTAAFTASETLNRRFGLHRGFGTYDEVAFRAGKGEDWWAASRDGAEVTGAFLFFLRSQPSGAGLFAWVHYYDAHLPYRPRPDFDRRYPKDSYAAQVAFLLCDRRWPEGWLDAALPSASGSSGEEAQRLRSLGYIGGGAPAAGEIRNAPIGRLMRDFSAWEVAREEALAAGRDDRLLELFPRLIETYPEFFALHKDYGSILGKTGRIDEAVREFETAAGLFAGDAVVFGNLGSLYLTQGRIEAARAALERSVAINPDQPGPQKNLGIIYLDHLHRTDKAVHHFRKYLEAGGDAESDRIRAFIRQAERTEGTPAR